MIRRLARAYRGEKRVLVMIGVLNIVSATSEALALVSVVPLVQAASEGEDGYAGSLGPIEFDFSIRELVVFSAIMLVVAFVVQILAAYVGARLTTGYRLRTRLSIVRAFQRADWSVQAREREGWLRTLSTDNVEFAANALNQLAQWLKGFTGLSIFILGAIAVDFVAATIITVVLGLIVALLRPVNKYARRLGAEHAEYNVAISEELATLTMTGRELKAYGVVGSATSNYRRLATEQRSVILRGTVAAQLGAPIFRTCAVLLIVGMIAYVAYRGDGDVAAVGLVAILLYRASNYGTVLVRHHQAIVRLAPIIDQLQEGLERLQSFEMTPGTLEPTHVDRIVVDDVEFRYPDEETAALESVSVSIEIGEVVGIVGPSGAGKSTLAELLIGLRRPTTGSILVDGMNLADLTDSARSRCIALVSQNVPLVPGTIADNVRFFREIDDETVIESMNSAGLSEMLADLPEGADTMIGPGARAVSGGQAQRIGIARALAGRPSLIVLDEPTSALDARSEEFVTQTIGALGSSFGVAVIAHRLTTLRFCDRVVVIEDGRITDQGAMSEVGERNEFLRHAIAAGSLQ